MNSIVKCTLVIILYALVLFGVVFVYSDIFQPVRDYSDYYSYFYEFNQIYENDFSLDESLALADEMIRIHKGAHNETTVLVCEESNNSDCFTTGSLLILPQPKSCYSGLVLDGVLPEGDEIAVSESIANSLGLRIGERVILKNFLTFREVLVSGIIKNAYGFPKEFDRNNTNTIVAGNSLQNWITYQPFSVFQSDIAYMVDGNSSIYSSRINEPVLYNVIFHLLLSILFLVAFSLIRRFSGISKYVKHQFLLGKKASHRRMIVFVYNLILFLVLGIIFCTILASYKIGVEFGFISILCVWGLVNLIQVLRIK